MPAPRDTSFAYESTTTDAGLTVPMCAYAQNDLLFAICVGDTGTPTWGCSNGIGTWNQLINLVNTASLTVYWKYAAASGEGDVVFTSTVNETYCGCVISWRDVFQGYTSGSPPLSANATSTGTLIGLPTLTTAVDNAAVMALISSSASAGSLAFLADALQELVKVDGAAESLGVGWFFKKLAGLTTAYNANANASGSGNKVVIEIKPPSGGATVIPAYPVSDASILLSPQLQAAWDSNTALAATADTNFGTSIAGKTCNDGTVAAAVDIGLDKGSFMSMAGLTNTTTANQMSGAEAVMAASRYNVGNRNIQTYFRHPTPAHNQRLSPLSSGRGVWFGMKSGATAAANWKVWQVHGGDVPMPPGYVMPITINAANTDTIATNGSITNSDIRRYGFWTGGIGALTQQSCFGPMWAMDTTVIAGGVADEPVDVPAIVKAAALNKDRFSSLLQGSNQMLCLQALQFGDGGTNQIYLKVNAAAVEFPSQKNAAKKQVNYNGTDNDVGWTFYPGASDTIDLAGTSFASASKFHWRFHASASASATYNLSGVAINGAGDVQLRAVTTFGSMSFSNCPTIYTNGAALASCSLLNSKLFVSSPANAALVEDSVFISGGTGHAIEISGTAANITLTGLQFSGYASSNGSTGNEAIYVNIASGTMTISIAGGGSTPSIRTAGATVNVVSGATLTLTGLVSGSDIVVTTSDTNTVRLSVDQNSGSTYAYSYSDPGATVDIKVIKAGYKVYTVYDFTLAAADASLPISQVVDLAYGS